MSKDQDLGGQARLVHEVIEKGICVRCGACVGLCPYLDYLDGQVAVIDRCRAEESRCLRACPRADDPTAETLFDRGDDEIGPYRQIFAARSCEASIREKAQYGGVVSALLIHGLKRGRIEAAVLTDAGGAFSPSGAAAEDEAGVLGCAGSRYSGSGSLSVLNRALKRGREGLGVVGIPCQMEAIARMERLFPEGKELSARLPLKIGLFCTWALDYRALRAFLERKGAGRAIKKFDIPPPPSETFQVWTDAGRRDFHLSEVRPFIQKGCAFCRDLTAEQADLSVGALEGREGWNTLVVRTEQAARWVEEAVDCGRLETEPMPEENLRHLKEASLGKRERGKAVREKISGSAS